MADTGYISPGTMANDSAVGAVAWSNPDNAKASDGSYATLTDGDATNIYDTTVKLVKGGSISGDNKATSTDLISTEAYISYGGSSDLWGNTLTYSDINAITFGVAFSYTMNTGDETVSNYLKATNFGFSIPTGATIDGVFSEIEVKQIGQVAYVDHIRIKVYYTETSGTNMQINISDTWKDVSAMKINIGDTWKDVTAVKQNIGDTWKDVF